MSADHGKQFTIYMHAGGPNPWKVIIVFEELGLTYHMIFVDTSKQEHRLASYTDKNPNGRLPTIIDHKNNDFTIWESGAILMYLVGKYDKKHKISFSGFDTIATANQYLMFQMSGQGPYFGQAIWFTKYHAEKIPSAIDRYDAEIRRVLGVLEVILADKEYLVENRVSYVDLAFVPWNWLLKWLPNSAEWEKDFPKVAEWDGRLNARESVKKAREIRADALKA